MNMDRIDISASWMMEVLKKNVQGTLLIVFY